MRKKTIINAGIGFLAGMASGMIIAFIFSRISGHSYLFDPSLLERFHSETAAFLVNTILSGIYGAVCFAGMSFYEMENWGLLKATVLHCLLINISFLCTGLFLDWIPLQPVPILLSILFITGGFFAVWLIMFMKYKSEVKDLNQLLQEDERKKNSNE